eukprot:431061_1
MNACNETKEAPTDQCNSVNNKNPYRALALKRKTSKLKERKLQSKLKRNKIKYEQIRKRKIEEQNKISTNDMYPNFVPLSKQEIELIATKVNCIHLNDLKVAINLGNELDDGPIEFKWKMISPSIDRFKRRLKQMKYRLNEGNGQCVYEIGIEDNGNPKGLNDKELIETLKTVFRLNKQINGNIQITSIKRGLFGKVATVKIVNKSVVESNME